MSNPFIGIGAGLAQIPRGLMEGEEIARRREREDKAMAWQEKQQNRQEGEWNRQDAYRSAMALGTNEERLAALQKAGLGDYAHALENEIRTEQRASEMFDINKEVGRLQLKTMRRQEDTAELDDAIAKLLNSQELGGDEAARVWAEYSPILDKYMPGLQSIRMGQGLSRFGDRNVIFKAKEGKAPVVMSLGEFGARIRSPHLIQEAHSERQNWVQQQHLGLQRAGLAASMKTAPVAPFDVYARAKASGGFANEADAAYVRAHLQETASKNFDEALNKGGADLILQKMDLPKDTPLAAAKRFYIATELDRNQLLNEKGLQDLGLDQKVYEEWNRSPMNPNAIGVFGQRQEGLRRLVGPGGNQVPPNPTPQRDATGAPPSQYHPQEKVTEKRGNFSQTTRIGFGEMSGRNIMNR